MEARVHGQHKETVAEETLNRVVDFGFICILFIAPLALGGRFAGGRLLLTIMVGVTAFTWFLSRAFSKREQVSWFWTGAEWLCGLSILLVALQLLPLSPALLQQFSPETQRLLPMHSVGTDGVAPSIWSTWGTVSLTPSETRGGLAMLLTYVMLFLVVVQRTRRRRDVERMLKMVALAGISMAAIGLAQRFFGNGKFLWIMEHPSRDTLMAVKGTFVNENHFAHFLALCLGPLLWWIVKANDEPQNAATQSFSFGGTQKASFTRTQVMLSIGLGIVLIAGLMTFSRGGLAVMTLAAVITFGLLALQKRIGMPILIAAGVVAGVAAVAVMFHGQDVLAREIGTLNTISMESFDEGKGRRKIWNAVLRAVPDYAMLGSGVGSHRFIYPTYFSERSSVHYTHAESGYLQVLLETGGPGLGMLLVGVGFSGYWIACALFRKGREDVDFLAVPIAAAWIVSVLHGLTDFNWYIPANMTVTLILVGLGARLWNLSRNHATRKAVPRVAWGSLTVAIAVMATFSVTHFVGPARGASAWQEYMAWSLASNRFKAQSVGPGRQRSLGLVDPSIPQSTGRMIELLDETLQQDPNNGRAHIRMAALCLRHFELLQAKSDNAMSLAQIRDAALTSGFASHAEMSEWVTKVVADNRPILDRVLHHTRKGLSLTPTEGPGYLYLGEVAFLDESMLNSEYALLQQAYAVRPYHAGIQFVYGRQELLAGDSEKALALWKDAFRRGSSVRRRIIAAVGFQAPPQEVLQIFDPDLDGLRDLFEYYSSNNLASPLRFVGQRYVGELEKQAKLMSGETAGKLWFDAQFVHATLGDLVSAANAAQHSVVAEPTNYEHHFVCALRLRDSGQLKEAIEEFRWCHMRRPENEDLPKVISQLQSAMRRPEKTARGAVKKSQG